VKKDVTETAMNVTRGKERTDMKWLQILTVWAGLTVVAFLLATMYSLNLPRIIP